MLHLNNFAKIGKAILIAATGVQQNYVSFSTDKYINEKKCAKSGCSLCPNRRNDNEEIQKATESYCLDHCPYKCVEIKKTYHNEGNAYKISGYERLSKIQLKQFLLYHFLWVDERGIIKNINEADLAKALNCTIKTIRNNNIVLQKHNYIACSRSSNSTISVLLLDYPKYHLEKYKGGCGYITMSKSMIQELLDLKNVNTLRLEIRQILKQDNAQATENTFTTYSYKECLNFLPDYMKGKKSVTNLLTSNLKSNLFHLSFTESNISFSLKDVFNGKLQRKNLEMKYSKELNDFLKKSNLIFDEKEVDDLLQMSIQYDVTLVKNAILKMKNYLSGIKNVGGYIRTLICNELCSLA